MSTDQQRQAVIDQAFNKFATGDSVEASALKAGFQGHLHPRVISGELSMDEVFLEFLTHFSDANRDGCISRQEWNAYYADISARVPDEAHFCQLMRQVWKL